MSENGEIYTAGKNFTLPPGLTAWTNSTSVAMLGQVENQLRDLDRLRLDRTQDARAEVEGFGLVEKVHLREVIAAHLVVSNDAVIELCS